MHRFRKKSDVKRSEVPTSTGSSHPAQLLPYPIVTQHVQVFPPPDPPALPPESDFRTSLILPDLSRRFTLLRSTNGNQLNLENLRSRFAEQRAKGAENQISQEEEDMLLDMLSRMRGTGFGFGHKSPAMGENVLNKMETSASSIISSDATSSTSSTVRQSSQSTLSSSAVNDAPQSPSSPSRSVKRHSNNLFGAGQLRDMRYMRKPASNRTINSNRSVSSTPSESTTGSMTNALIEAYSDNPIRSVSPESPSSPVIPPSNLVPSSPTRSVSSTQEDALGPLPNSSRLSKQLTSGQIQRISVSLEDAIRELEEEAEDQVLVPRTPVLSQHSGSASIREAKSAVALTTDDVNPSTADTAESNNASSTMSWVAEIDRPSSAGGYRSPSPYRAGGSASPVPRVPGYIPGMPRPVTPAREADLEDARSLSTTPRASSPLSAYDRTVNSVLPLSASASSLLRQAVNSSLTPYGARPISPHQSVRGIGRSTPEDRLRNGTNSTDYSPSSSHWRRPSSPLSTNSAGFQSLNGGSRPSTPSNVTWNVPGKSTQNTQNSRPLGRNGTLLGHSKVQSGTDTEDNSDSIDRQATIRSRPSLTKATSDDFTNKESRNKFLSNGSTLTASALAFVDYDPTETNLPNGVLSPSYDAGRFSSSTSVAENVNTEEKGLPSLLTPPSSPFAQKFNSNPLFISSLSNNSSRSSLVSAGSSYHSWEEENNVGVGFIRSPDKIGPVWHDVSTSAGPSSHNSLGGRGQSASDDPENILRQYTGLSKADLRSIQDKLIDATQNRSKNQEVRAPSTLRRRRPSTAQSFHSNGQPSRTTSPAPVYDFQWNANTENAIKANELLNSMVDSIKLTAELERTESENTEVELAPPPPIIAPLPTSSPGRRNKDLADILFGSSEAEPVPVIPEIVQLPSPVEQVNDTAETGEHQEEEVKDTPDTPKEPSQTIKGESRNLELPSIHDPVDTSKDHPPDLDLVRQVQERTEAAMAQLRRSPQQGRFPTSGPHMTKKKIHLQDISGPLLVQSSTSIDKIPNLPTSPNKTVPYDSQRTVKLSFSKRLRNTLRSKNAPNGDEITPWTLDNGSASSANSFRVGDRSLSPSKTSPLGPGSVTDLHSQPKGPTVSPPASAGPNLKSFMSRFRKKTGTATDSESKNGTSSIVAPISPSQTSSSIDGRRSLQLPSNSTPLLARSGSVSHVVTLMAPSMSRQTTETPTINASSPVPPVPSQSTEPAALKQFYEAAQSLGLDQSALNDFLARSHSSVKSSDFTSSEKAFLDPPRATSPPLIPEVLIERAPLDLTRSNTLRQYTSSPASATPRRVREIADTHGNYRNTIVRRTIIYPSANGSTPDVASLVRKSSKSQRRTSNTSMLSNRSIHDRVPTPPPLRAKRQSVDPSPPVPTLPVNFTRSRPSSRLAPETPVDRMNSPYESFYDMYSGDRSASVHSPDLIDHPKTPLDDGLPEMEEGQALEVIELANGETIWSIVNGLRADDAESFYPRRGSMDSEYSTMPPHDGENEQLFFKEHARTGSKSSSISNYSRRKVVTAPRPETKVFYSSSANIARLIEQLSQNTEAATFNIKPKESSSSSGGMPGHSHSGSLPGSVQTDSDLSAHWTVEERLERMLDTVNSAI